MYAETRIEVLIRPRRDRDRRRDATTERARRLLGSLKSYLMARENDGKSLDPEEPADVTAESSPRFARQDDFHET
jgi:hypothetical protein